MLIKHNKLVRDKIPEIIRQKGDIPKTVTLDDEAYFQCLNQKLKEEVDEYFEAYDTEELADILEVVYAIAKYKGLSIDELTNMRLKKRNDRGGFDERVFLVEVLE